MKTKIVSLLLAACMALSMVGCGKDLDNFHIEKISVEVESNTVFESEENYETVIEVTPNFKTFFPDTLVLNSDRMIRMRESTDMNGTEVVSLTEMYQNEEESYTYMDLNGDVVLKTYTQKDDVYVYVDMSKFALSTLKPENYEEIKKEFANETGVPEGEVTDEDITSYIKSHSILYGYSKVTEELLSPSAETGDLMGMDNIKNVLDKYAVSNLSLVSEDNNKIVAKYAVDSSDVIITLDKITKEIEKITYKYKENILPPGLEENMQITNVEIEFLDHGQIDTSWITKDTDYTAEDVIEQYMFGIFTSIFSQMDFEGLQNTEGFDNFEFKIEDEVWEED